MKIDWKRKLTSRKLWVAVAGFVSGLILAFGGAENTALWCLGRSLELLATADVAYFASGWKNARGCKIEHICAEQYGINIVEA